ncbi:hypothetical protein PAXRUDRAFT_13325 [Paxillus rubicundulus Ve08.2h10]|uniref:Uncharacterized protein n=1 Tax=Paxillus rubicundulus Ve08.2h10 TaxID=930991 RepID=A0A0D0DU00_9AGAM|nr:hypothetical protein PAXRUDRAFT_13325 [Paxillus rubicundulus Ve08.2h10]
MSSFIANDLTKWNDEQLHEHEDDDNKLFKKSAECRDRMKVWKEVEHQKAEGGGGDEVESGGGKAEAEVKAWRRVEVEAKACAEEVMQVQSSVSGPSKGKQPKVAGSGKAEVMEQAGGLAPCYGCSGAGVVCKMKMAGGDMQSTWRRKWEEVMLPQARKKKVWTQSPVVDNDNEYKEEVEVEEECDVLGALTEALVAVVTEMQNVAVDRRHVAAESHAQMEQMLGILEEIQGCLDLEFSLEEPKVGLEEEFEEEEVVEAAEEREALKGWSKEEVEVDKSM